MLPTIQSTCTGMHLPYVLPSIHTHTEALHTHAQHYGVCVYSIADNTTSPIYDDKTSPYSLTKCNIFT